MHHNTQPLASIHCMEQRTESMDSQEGARRANDRSICDHQIGVVEEEEGQRDCQSFHQRMHRKSYQRTVALNLSEVHNGGHCAHLG